MLEDRAIIIMATSLWNDLDEDVQWLICLTYLLHISQVSEEKTRWSPRHLCQ